MNDRDYQMIQVNAKREEMMRTAENERLVRSIRRSKPSLWARVQRFIVLPKRRSTTLQTQTAKCKPVKI